MRHAEEEELSIFNYTPRVLSLKDSGSSERERKRERERRRERDK
jgi:hypothetical protein